MNNKTKDDLIEFIDRVEKLAMALLPIIGPETYTEVVDGAEKLKVSLHHDETILEVR